MKVLQQGVALATASIRRRTDNPNHMDAERYDLLVKAIEREGFLQPILVRPLEGASPYLYEMIDGHHRLDACESLGHRDILAVVVEAGDDEALALQVGLNKLRGELDLMQCANQLQQLVEEYHWDINALQATGFTLEECGAALELAAVAGDPEADLLSEPLGLPEPKKGKGRPVIELEFTTREEMLQTRKALRKVNPDAGAAVRFLLGFEDDDTHVAETDE